MSKLISIWNFICRRKYLITIVAFAVIIGFLDENSLVRRLGYEREISQLKEEIEIFSGQAKPVKLSCGLLDAAAAINFWISFLTAS